MVIQLENVTVSYTRDSPVLKGVNLKIFDGERVFIIGPNGGGKTTLLKTILGSVKPVNGVVKLFNTELPKFREWWKIGYVPQNVTQLFEAIPLSVEELLYSGSVKGKSMKPSEALSLVGVEDIDEIMKKRVANLSGGNLQKAMLALALINRPKLLLLDEPTVFVDQTGIDAFMHILNKLRREWGLTMLIATHDVAAISTFASRVICINRSSLYDGDINTLISSEQLCNIYGFHVYSLRHGHRWSET
ncbi:MAG: metal ABC transporter ATP-binding protein [Candidatus Caldarchaeum sp.]|nr:metal ABC transporter ATP-binding protein [Candidatus Caldarchaeum sp.]MCS7134071.1 metal ABC transporter ATP-binding protein [Candidatus Caldarchaeum sp.]MCX8201269.1 metal ABC transporter ATP-binding protein [Candidatus Caldarchaeum sp.]MDW8435577.1 metal ABC transporter ATP-binding protein [Candidatus Caldarchaeum sp.]